MEEDTSIIPSLKEGTYRFCIPISSTPLLSIVK
jgi:hypothetical protein